MPLIDLERVDVAAAVVPMNIDHDLSGAGDGVGGHRGMMVAQQGEIGDGVQTVKKRTGQHEKIAEHAVAVPVHGQFGQAVEDITGAAARLFDMIESGGDKPLETVFRVQVVDLHPGVPGRDQGAMAGKPEIDQRLALPGGGGDKGGDQGPGR